MTQHILLIGATSAVAEAIGRLYAKNGARISLIARRESRLSEVVSDLTSRGAKCHAYVADIRDRPLLTKHLDSIFAEQPLDRVFCCHGVLGNTDLACTDVNQAVEILDINFNSAALILSDICYRLVQIEQPATIVGISSVAGDRGRQSNFYYGAAKAGMSVFLQGLRNRYFSKGIHVLTVKPGFLDTPMTADIPKNALFVSPDFVAKSIVTAIKRGRNEIYVPGVWRIIMVIIKMVPEFLFKRLSL